MVKLPTVVSKEGVPSQGILFHNPWKDLDATIQNFFIFFTALTFTIYHILPFLTGLLPMFYAFGRTFLYYIKLYKHT